MHDLGPYSASLISLLNTENLFFVGIDGGATNCRASIFDRSGEVLGCGRSGSANPVNGVKITLDSILHAVKSALEDARKSSDTSCQLQNLGLNNLIVGAGLAGLALPGMQQALADWRHPFHSLYITTDTYAATLGAHEGQDGAIIILGTGFSALGLVDGKEYPVGGHGFPIGATCSGSWFGLEAVKAVLLDIDELGLKTSMTQELLGDDSVVALVEKMNNAPAQHFARFAPLVFSHAVKGDAVANNLIQEGAAFIDNVIQRLLSLGVSRIAFVGGVAAHITPWINESYNSYIVDVKESPEQGAMIFARNAFVMEKKV